MLTRNEIYDDDNNEDNVDVFKTKFILLTQDNAIDFLNKYQQLQYYLITIFGILKNINFM